MPLATISLRRGKSIEYRCAISAAVHTALVETFGIPADDRFQILRELDADDLVYDPNFLGIERSDDIVMVQIILRSGRSRDLRVAFHRRLAELLANDPGMRPEDVFIVLVENDYADWSVGRGEAPLMALLGA